MNSQTTWLEDWYIPIHVYFYDGSFSPSFRLRRFKYLWSNRKKHAAIQTLPYVRAGYEFIKRWKGAKFHIRFYWKDLWDIVYATPICERWMRIFLWLIHIYFDPLIIIFVFSFLQRIHYRLSFPNKFTFLRFLFKYYYYCALANLSSTNPGIFRSISSIKWNYWIVFEL